MQDVRSVRVPRPLGSGTQGVVVVVLPKITGIGFLCCIYYID